MIRLALDSNILIYSAEIDRGVGGAGKITAIQELLLRLSPLAKFIVSTQALGETFNLAVKAGYSRETAQTLVSLFCARFSAVAPSVDDFTSAVQLATAHKLQIWDSLILTSAATAHCAYLLSEDMQDGFTWRGVSVLNPLSERAEQLLFG